MSIEMNREVEQPKKFQPKRSSNLSAKNWLLVILITILLTGGVGAYWWRDQEAKAKQQLQDAEITALKQQIRTLESQLAQQGTTPTEEDNPPINTDEDAPTAQALENIKGAISSGNTAALEGYMAPTVRVIIAASEGLGDRTPIQAIGDLEYLDSAIDPWNFNVPAAIVAGYRASFYRPYFPGNALVGKSADDSVVSFTFNDAGNISGIFMAAHASLLQ